LKILLSLIDLGKGEQKAQSCDAGLCTSRKVREYNFAMELPDTSSLEFLHREWPVIKAAPSSFVACVLLAVIIIWILIWWLHKERLERDAHSIAHLQREVSRLEKEGTPMVEASEPAEQARQGFSGDPVFKLVRGVKFHNETVELDGKRFEDCTFTNVTVMFHGTAPMEIENSEFAGSLLIQSDDPAVNHFVRVAESLRNFHTVARFGCISVDEKGNTKERLSDWQRLGVLRDAEGVIQEQAKALAAIRVYPQDLECKLLTLCHGTTFFSNHSALFLKLSMVSDEEVGIRDISIFADVDGTLFTGKPMEDLSGWIIHIPVMTKTYPYKNFDEHNLNALSLWRSVKQHGLKPGIERNGWIGLKVPNASPKQLGNIRKLQIEVTRTQRSQPYRFTFREWASAQETIFDAEVRQQ